jgi:hypothetical protein
MSIQSMDQCLEISSKPYQILMQQKKACGKRTVLLCTYLNGWLIQMPKIGSCLPGFLAKHHCLWVNQTEGINYHLSFNTLDWIHDHCHSTLIQSFKTLLISNMINQSVQIAKTSSKNTETNNNHIKKILQLRIHPSSERLTSRHWLNAIFVKNPCLH